MHVIYLLGAEDYGLPPAILERCGRIVSLEAVRSPYYKVAVAGIIVLYDWVFGTPKAVQVPAQRGMRPNPATCATQVA